MTARKTPSTQASLFAPSKCLLCSRRAAAAFHTDEHGSAWFCQSCSRAYTGAMFSVGWTVPGFLNKMGGPK